jgi:phage tail-like protein
VASTVESRHVVPGARAVPSEESFRTTSRIKLFGGPGPRPASVSARSSLVDGLPALYRSPHDIYGFTERFVASLETVLDPDVAILDALPSYFRADFAPDDVLELLGAWMGVELDETHTIDHRREVVRSAAELARRRGTRAGLELALRLTFPEVSLRVEDGGGVQWAATAEALPAVPRPQVVVYCEEALPSERLTAIARYIERAKPVHVAYKLRVPMAEPPAGEAP